MVAFSPQFSGSSAPRDSTKLDVADEFRRAATYVDISKHVGRVNGESIVVDEIAP